MPSTEDALETLVTREISSWDCPMTEFHCSNCCPNKKSGLRKWGERIIEAAIVTSTITIVGLILKFLGF